MMTEDFKRRLFPILPRILDDFKPDLVGSPIPAPMWALSPGAVILDELGIRGTIEEMKRHLLIRPGDNNFFAVKCNPNIHLLRLILETGFGLDCASPTELYLALAAGAPADRIMYTANNLSAPYLDYALRVGCIINLDDITALDLLETVLEEGLLEMPKLICFRYNPGKRRIDGGANFIIGEPEDQKYGLTYEQIFPAYKRAKQMGAQEFGIHTMYASNCLDHAVLAGNVKMQLEMVNELQDTIGSPFTFINAGGGIGVNYRPHESPVDLAKMGEIVNDAMAEFRTRRGYLPHLWFESGRYVAAPHGVLAGRVINVLSKYKMFVGVDFCDAADLHRANIYQSAWHRVSLLNADGQPRSGHEHVVDIVGPLCENVRLAQDRQLPAPQKGDLIVVEDAGGHGQAMKMNYNGWGASQALMLHPDNSVSRIGRAETIADLLNTQIMPGQDVFKMSY
jgi:diaminopimelate decarboxylase